MREGPNFAAIAALIGDPARANMLTALVDGRALTVSELAAAAGVALPTASGHLARMEQAGLPYAPIRRPDCYDEMLRIADRIAEDLDDYIRVDLYATDRGAVLGELTSYSNSGTGFTEFASVIMSQAWENALDQYPLIAVLAPLRAVMRLQAALCPLIRSQARSSGRTRRRRRNTGHDRTRHDVDEPAVVQPVDLPDDAAARDGGLGRRRQGAHDGPGRNGDRVRRTGEAVLGQRAGEVQRRQRGEQESDGEDDADVEHVHQAVEGVAGAVLVPARPGRDRNHVVISASLVSTEATYSRSE